MESVSTREIEGEVLLMNSNIGELFTLNSLGLFIWQQIANNRSLAEIIDLVNEEYHIPSDQVLFDVMSFLEELEVNGFLAEVKGWKIGKYSVARRFLSVK